MMLYKSADLDKRVLVHQAADPLPSGVLALIVDCGHSRRAAHDCLDFLPLLKHLAYCLGHRVRRIQVLLLRKKNAFDLRRVNDLGNSLSKLGFEDLSHWRPGELLNNYQVLGGFLARNTRRSKMCLNIGYVQARVGTQLYKRTNLFAK